MIVCIDCGAPNPATVDDTPLCAACYTLAITLIGSAARRVQMIQNHEQGDRR